MREYQELVNSYSNWFQQKIRVESINGVFEITTPFLDRHNDHIQLYLKKHNGGFILTDDGYTLTDLKLHGCELTSDKRKQIRDVILNGFGVKLDGDEMVIEANRDNFAQRKHNLIQALLSINDLYYLASPVVLSLFKEDVEKYLKMKEIRYTPEVSFTGKSEFAHSFDFVVPSSQTRPERILKVIDHLDKQKSSLMIFSWNDTREVRPSGSTAYCIINDVGQSVNSEHLNALEQYGIKPWLWSHRDEEIQELAM